MKTSSIEIFRNPAVQQITINFESKEDYKAFCKYLRSEKMLEDLDGLGQENEKAKD